MRLRFVKMHGAGNDFVMIDDRGGTFPADDPSAVALLANRPDGIGCEGVILVQRSATADFRMRFFNPDGTEAELCGNGARCVAAFALEIGAAESPKMRFETLAGEISAEVLGGGIVRIAMPAPRDLRGDFVNSGVPHAIVPVDDLSAADVEGEGRRMRRSAAYAPDGTNVDFVEYEPPHRLRMRTYERGVEAETFACGTGAVAAAVVGVAAHGMEFPVTVATAHGVELVVDGVRSASGAFSGVTLAGPVRRVFSGEIELSPPTR